MFNKLNIKTLAIIFGVLVLIVALTQWLKSSGNDRNFRESLVEVDTAKITSITIIPKGQKEPMVLKKTAQQWDLLYKNKTYHTDHGPVNAILKSLTELRPERLAATGEESREQYEVGESSGTRVKVEESGKTTAAFIIGKVSYQQNYQSMNTFIRLENEQDIYAVSGFQVMNFNQDLNSLRFKALGKGSYDKISRITFSYPDSSFTLTLNGKIWNVNGMPADSLNVYNYLQMITNAIGSSFADDATPLKQPVYSVLVESDAKNVMEIKAFPADSTNMFYVTSTANPGAVFSENRDGLIKNLFVPQKHFRK